MTVMKIILMVIFIIDLLLGLATIACGIWFHASLDVHAYMTVFVRSENDQTLVGAAGIFLAMGFVLTALVIAGGLGVFFNKSRLIHIYLWLGCIPCVLGLICGFMCVGLRHDIHRFVPDGMRAQLENQYTWDGRIGRAWNRIQVKKRCCGVVGSWDYRTSDWFAGENSDLVEKTSYVPDSCCVLNFNQDRELYWVNPQELQLKDKLRCNQDAEGMKDGSANLHGQGCFAALFSKNRDLWHDQNIFTVMDVISGLGLAAGFYQIFVLGLSFIYLQMLRTEEDLANKPTLGRY